MKNSSLAFAALHIRDVRYFVLAIACFTLASRALLVVISFQIYQLTRSPFALGILGLVEAVPALSLVLLGGYVADHYDRRRIMLITRAVSFLCAVVLTLISLDSQHVSLIALYAVIFLAGIARAFADPANTAFEAQIVPQHLTVNAVSWIGSIWILGSIIGPAMIGFVFAEFGAAGSYLTICLLFLLSWILTLRIQHKPLPPPAVKHPPLKSIQDGWGFVMKSPPLWSSMALDLCVVLFSGAVALLPIFAVDVLNAGPIGLGLLNAALPSGSLISMLVAAKHPPLRHAGRNLMITIAGFGASVLVFAISREFTLSIIALIFAGIFDGISMVIRRAMVRLLSPDTMRGRIAAVSWVFVCASNELGAFYSGMMASLIGAVATVSLGGTLTFAFIGLATWAAPELRRLRFDPKTLERTI